LASTYVLTMTYGDNNLSEFRVDFDPDVARTPEVDAKALALRVAFQDLVQTAAPANAPSVNLAIHALDDTSL